ncbi:MAG: biotin--[acetyl-CoA-carboxylase] ligase [Prevotellaceae bacterium]|jgi:BirA family biotin operon repressor/biotin-[acetyl-CoA-carboxylase] ligase|nr:biotin--[acetyl-CoA-carboxylase] ligase [Prevotellaceae bacterium]
MNIIRIKETASTNAFLRELSEKETLPESTVLVAENQTAGRGQAGNSWETAAGKNLTFSLLLRPTFLPVEQHFLLSEAVALGVKEALDEYVEKVSVKWSNDIYVGERKIAGILIENELTGREITQSIIGIGLNVNQKTFVSDAPNPVSLYQLLGRETDLEELLSKILEHISVWYLLLKHEKFDIISDFYYQNLYRRDGFYDYEDKNGVFRAKIKSVSPEGYLILQTDVSTGSTTVSETRSYEIKEVKFI